MENLNAEQVKKALECCSSEVPTEFNCPACPYKEKGCNVIVMRDALALINSQEQRIKELTQKVADEKAKGAMCAEVIKRQDKEIAKKDAEIKKLRAEGKWISVEDRLPPKYETVLVCTCGGVATDFISGGAWYEHRHIIVTHWMPLPEVPKGE